ncbi:MAG TPA: PIG-L family deacetylase [Polyangiaceae bacterium]|jgi:LmbE family N-acetylglucosaminyl deacetylase|nr:PIG-L family deacetylase [Polyangiaceae bacterium]
MNLSHSAAEIFIPDQLAFERALPRTTHLGVGAHQDDLEFMAAHGILECFARDDRWFTGVIVTDGAGSARDFEYKGFSDEQMKEVRRREQKKAAYVGEYAAQFLLSHPSSSVKDAKHEGVLQDLTNILRATQPEVVYTHNLADKHDTHVAVALRVIAACRALEPSARPQRLIGCEVWRDLDWLCDADKVQMAVDRHENLQSALMGVFDSQIAGGKRYDLATAGRRKAHATYFESHGTDQHTSLIWGMDLTPLMHEGDPSAHVTSLMRRFEDEVLARVRRLGG